MILVKKYLYEILKALERDGELCTLDIMRRVGGSKYNMVIKEALVFAENRGLVHKNKGQKNTKIYSLSEKGQKFLECAKELEKILGVL